MRAAPLALIVANGALGLGILATYQTELGRARWHDDAAYAALAVAALLLLPLWRTRRFTTLVLASAGAWSAITGILLVYVTPWMLGGRWMTWWHAATSAAFVLAFLAHWIRNNARLWQLVARLAQRRAALALVVGAWAIALGALVWTFATRAAFTETIAWRAGDVALWSAGAAALGGIALARTRLGRALRARVGLRNRARGATDATLLGAMWLATATGAALVLAGRGLRGADAYWLTIGWHLVASYALVGLALWHAAFNARPLASHAG